MKASEFKARCLAMLDEVAEHHKTIIVTKHGKPVAKLVALDSGSSLMGSVTLDDADDTLFDTGEAWDAV